MTDLRADLTRSATFDIDATRAEGDDRIPVVVSTDAPVLVEDGVEVLVHSADAVDLRRAPLPIIVTHAQDQISVGVVEDLVIANGQMRGMARFGTRPEAAGFRDDVLNRTIRSVSVGYGRIRSKYRGDGVLVTSRWLPKHCALTAEPADIGAGFFRTLAAEPFVLEPADPAPPSAAAAASLEHATMAEATAPAATTAEPASDAHRAAPATVPAQPRQASQANPDDAMTAVAMEQQRATAIRNLVKSNNLDSRMEERWIRQGTPLHQVANEMLEVMEERGRAKPASPASLGLTPNEMQRYSLFRVIRMLGATNRQDADRFEQEAAFELEASRAVAKQLGRSPDGIFVPADILRRPMDAQAMQRAMTAQPGTSGGYLVGTENMGFIDILRNRSVLSRMGARTLSGLTGNVTIPRQTGSATLTWQAGETASATPSDQTIGQLSLTPRTAIAVTEVGRTLMLQSSPSAESMVTADLAQVVAKGVDLAGINGAGGAQPLGICNTPGITTGQDASSADYAKVLAFQTAAANSNAILGGAGYITRPATAATLMGRSRFANTDTPLWDGNILDGKMAGFGAMSSLQVPSGNLIFGSFEEVVIGEWGVLELMLNPYQNFNAGVVAIRAIYSCDVLVRYPQAFVRSTNAS